MKVGGELEHVVDMCDGFLDEPVLGDVLFEGIEAVDGLEVESRVSGFGVDGELVGVAVHLDEVVVLLEDANCEAAGVLGFNFG